MYNGLAAIPTANLLAVLRQNGILVGAPDNVALPTVTALVQLLDPAVTQAPPFCDRWTV